MQSTRTCAFDGCDNASRSNGLCHGHYSQRRNGRELRPLSSSSKGLTLEQRFWAKVNKDTPSGCWEWTGATSGYGYGQIGIGKKRQKAHRVSWELVNCPIPDGMELDHLCSNPKCVNPYHLRAVTHAQNMQHLTGANKRSVSGVRGVYWNKQRKAWHAKLSLNGRQYHGGFHSTIEDADKAAKDLRAKLFTHSEGSGPVDCHPTPNRGQP